MKVHDSILILVIAADSQVSKGIRDVMKRWIPGGRMGLTQASILLFLQVIMRAGRVAG